MPFVALPSDGYRSPFSWIRARWSVLEQSLRMSSGIMRKIRLPPPQGTLLPPVRLVGRLSPPEFSIPVKKLNLPSEVIDPGRLELVILYLLFGHLDFGSAGFVSATFGSPSDAVSVRRNHLENPSDRTR